MLATGYVGLRCLHFAALMLLFGCTLFISRLASRQIAPLMTKRFCVMQRGCLWLGLASALMMYVVQGGMMGNGWQDVWQPQIWLAVAGTQFGHLWLWQLLLAVTTLLVAYWHPRQQGRLALLAGAQLLLLAGTGHAAMREGLAGTLQRGNHALHLLSAAAWLGSLLPVLFCMRLARSRHKSEAIHAMMRFSRYGHLAVAGVLATGVINTLLIQGQLWSTATDYGCWLIAKCALVALMVAIALVNRYVLVPRLGRQRDLFITLTWAEVALGIAVLVLVSQFATWEPF